MVDLQALPRDVREYIDRQHRAACDANQCEHRPTSQGELDGITAGAAERYAAAADWLASIPTALKSQCQAVYQLNHPYGGQELVEEKLDGRWMLVPRYLTIVDHVRKLAAIFTPPASAREGAPSPAATEAVQSLARACGVTTYTNRTGPTSWAFGPEAWAKFCAALTAASQEPIAWIRFCSDGSYEGPLMNAAIDAVRKASGAWTPLRAPTALAPQVIALLAQASNGPGEDATDAAKWRALLSCARVRPLGSAGCEGDAEHNPDYAHIGFELWTHYQLTPEQADIAERERALGRKWLGRFVEKAQRVAAATRQVPAAVAATTD